MDDYLACSDLCEEHLFTRQAALLRAAAGEGGKAYLVAERGVEYNDEYDYVVEDDGEPQAIFLDRAEAERAADLRNGQRFREIVLGEYANYAEGLTSLPEPELNRRVSEILGEPWELFPDDTVHLDRFPDGATDEQMIAVARLFDKLRFFHVLEVEFGI